MTGIMVEVGVEIITKIIMKIMVSITDICAVCSLH
jgi:hypothetical protein